MSLKINTNTSSIFSGYQLGKSQEDLKGSLERISTGKKINKASDDASGMIIANKLASQAKGFEQAIKNANDAISIAQIADGSLGQAVEIVQDVRVKAIAAANAAQSFESRAAIQADVDKALSSLKDIADMTSFNGQKLLSGAFTNKEFQVGGSANETITISIGSIDPDDISHDTLGSLSSIDLTTPEGAQEAIEITDAALEYINSQRSSVGSVQNQLESTINNLSSARVNTEAAKSTILDLDFAEESINLNKIKILQRARTFALAQANKTTGKILDSFE